MTRGQSRMASAFSGDFALAWILIYKMIDMFPYMAHIESIVLMTNSGLMGE